MPIRAEDYEGGPLKFSFGKNSEILGIKVVNQSTEDIGRAWKHESGKLVFGPVLLNSKEEVEVSILITSNTGEIQATGHILQGTILQGRSHTTATRIFILFGSIFIAVGLVFLIQLPVIIAALGIIGVVLLLIALLAS